ncbi:MAG TPA: SPOR domain-containing protein [Gammaproteobacteria bacterium]|nr:SPOR domain-containing protein [Gammaproteobacteria bacterium]
MKERLIGAAVLVVLGVLVIPWVLDGRGAQQETSANALRLPAPEEPVPVRTETIRVGGQPEAASVVAEPVPIVKPPAASSDEQQVAAADVARESEPNAAAAASSPPPAGPAASTAGTPRPAGEQSGATAPTRSPAPASAPPTSAAPVQAARPAAKGAWTVQLGSFGDDDNARKQAQRVGTYGYKPAVSTLRSGGRVLYRVRVGSYDKKSEADATASSLSAHGFVAQVVAAD